MPLLKLISSLIKSNIGSDEVNVNSMGLTLVVAPLASVVDVIAMVGAASKLKVNVDASVLVFPEASAKAPTGTLIVYAP